MSADDRKKLVEDIFRVARTMPQDERASYVRKQCEGDETVYGQVKELCIEHDIAAALPDDPPSTHSLLLRRLSAHAPKTWRYELIDEVARGGMGAVLKVWDEDLRRTLAMKVMLSSLDSDEPSSEIDDRTLGRMLEEAQVTGQLDHPGIVPVHELGVDQDGQVYFTMPLVKGRTLVDIFELARKEEEGWTTTRAIDTIIKVCDAMAYAHSKGVLHRDLKPANVMVGRFGEVYVMDWGVAKVIGKDDTHDIRLNTAMTTATLRTERTEGESKGPDTPLVTMDGMVVGTPSYMPIEQARGEIDKVDVRSDVYSIGAMLYHLLAGEMPYVPQGMRPSAHAVWLWVVERPPRPLHEIAPNTPAELLAICEKAMERDQSKRYPSVIQLADDLRAYIDGRVVRAYETGAFAEARKWVKRNKGQATLVAAVILAIIGGLIAYSQAKAEGERKALEHAENIARVAALQEVERLVAEARTELWPVGSELSRGYDDWMTSAKELVAMLDSPSEDEPGFRQQLAAVRARAIPMSDAERDERRHQHPRFSELLSRRARFDALKFAQDCRNGDVTPQPASVDSSHYQMAPMELYKLAWPLVARFRETFGRELEGWALAEIATGKLESSDLEDDEAARVLLLKAHAHFAVGENTEAIAAAQAAAERSRLPEFAQSLDSLKLAVEKIDNGRAAIDLAQEEHALAKLETLIENENAWRFDDKDDEWLHSQLSKLINLINELNDSVTGPIRGEAHTDGWSIERRQEALRELKSETSDIDWDVELSAIAANSRYEGVKLDAQEDLFPLGPDPHSKLREYAHVLTGSIPERDTDGDLILKEDTALILVLIPGGKFLMGAQATDPTAPGYDPQAMSFETPPREVEVSPFFISKYEMTQAQWKEFTLRNPSAFKPKDYALDWNVDGAPGTLLHAVEQVSWYDADKVTRRLGLSLPSEAQWAYAARAGSTDPWFTGEEPFELADVANLADSFHASIQRMAHERWEDGHAVVAPVGYYQANDFGLHDVIGNVAEWCLDGFEATYYRRAPDTDPLRAPGPDLDRVVRGGSFITTSGLARSSTRASNAPTTTTRDVGLRPVRNL